jgi:hypothetical protein
MVKVMAADVPEQIKETLKSGEYKGWEKGQMFRSNDGQVYLLAMGKGSGAKEYRFDPQGKAIRGN